MGSHNYYKMFGWFSRKFKISEPEPPPDVKEAFCKYTDGGSDMSAEQLWRFLVEFQGETERTLSDAHRIIQEVQQQRHHHDHHLHHHLHHHEEDGFGLEDFLFFLFSADLNGPIKNQVHQDMTAPLHHYFIFTGHNSYLTGNQLSSDCSDVPIIKSLMRGVRVIELDLWPNYAKDNINVLHGRTLTTPVTLHKCLTSIKEHAFVKSPYPVIITLEDHLTPDLQSKVAEMVTKIFGDMLYYPESECSQGLPSPEELKHRIILSTKPPKEYLEMKETPEQTTAESECEEVIEDEDDDESFAPISSSRKSGSLAGLDYKCLIAIHAGKAKYGLKHALVTETKTVRRLSLSEQELERAASCHGTDLVRFTQKNILRVYPKGTRVTSSNFKPLTGWMYGAQMVAFNMQGYGKSLQLMHGMFRANGGCGYVKKPDFLMKDGPEDWVYDPKVALPVQKTLKVNVYLGDGWRLDFSHTHFDTFSPPDFYTKIYMIGATADYSKKKTKVVVDDWAPHWDQEFTFPVTLLELALLRIEVREHDMSEKDDFGGQTCLPVTELKPGIRAVPLHDKKGKRYRSVRLLMRFQFI